MAIEAGGGLIPERWPLRPEREDALRVLLIEDDPGDALLVREQLSDARGEVEVTWAPDVSSALGISTEAPFDCALVDLRLPDAEGLEVLRRVHAMDAGLPVVVLTGFEDERQGEMSLEYGAQDYLTKGSVTSDSLYRSIRYAIARHKSDESARRLLEAELARAENARLEHGLLARPIVNDARLHMTTRYRPGGQRTLLGGDFLDIVEQADGRIRAVIGDVSGHGPDEAALGVALRVAWRALVIAGSTPPETLDCLHRLIQTERQSDEIFASVCDLELAASRDQVRLHLAGHPPPVLLRGGKALSLSPTHAEPALGLFAHSVWTPHDVSLGEDWTLVAYTDGILERRNEGGGLSFVEDLAPYLCSIAVDGDDLHLLADRLIMETEALNGEQLRDDVALLIFSTGAHLQA